MKCFFLLFLLFPIQIFAADITNFCDGVPADNYMDLDFMVQKKDQVQIALHERDNREVIESLLVSYNTLNAKLATASREDVNPILAIAGFCYNKLPSSIAEDYKKQACPNIKPQRVRDLANLFLTAKAIINLSSGTETPEIKRIKDSKSNELFLAEIEELYSICGSELGTDEPLEEEIIPEEEEELPGVCTASPYSKLTEFLWKPVAEKDGRLVVLTNPTTSLVVNGETLTEYGASNGRCTTSRGVSSGCGYGEDVLIAVTTLSEFRIIELPNGCQRYDCKNSLTACGLKSWDTQELIKLKKQTRRLKLRASNTLKKKLRKKLKAQIKDNNRILKYAKQFGA